MELEFDQVAFFELLKTVFLNETSLVDWMCVQFNYERDAAYRRMNGKIVLSAAELNHIVLKLEEFGPVYVSHMPGHTFIMMSVADYTNEKSLVDLLDRLKGLLTKLLEDPTLKLKYIARDPSFFLFLSHPKLLQYKYNFWNMKKYTNTLSYSTIKKAQEVFELYTKINSEELCFIGAFKQQFIQLKSEVAKGKLTEEEGKEIFEALSDVMHRWVKWVYNNEKPGGGKISASLVDYITMNNGGIIESEKLTVYMGAIENARYYRIQDSVIINNLKDRFKQDFKEGRKVSRAKSKDLFAYRDLFPKWSDEYVHPLDSE